VLANGLVIYLRADRAGSANLALLIDRGTARRLGIATTSANVVIGRTIMRLQSARRTRVVIRLTRRARTRLRHAAKVAVTLTITLTDANRRSTTLRLKLTLRR
jgi:hypothetical protein